MKKNDYSIDSILSYISSDQSADAVLDLIREMDLEIMDVRTL